MPSKLQSRPSRQGREVGAVHAGQARGRGVQAGEDAEQRRLPGPGGADDGGELPRLDDQVEPLQGHHLDTLSAKYPDEPVADDPGTRGGVRGRGRGRGLGDGGRDSAHALSPLLRAWPRSDRAA
jgi:hypothetical protein